MKSVWPAIAGGILFAIGAGAATTIHATNMFAYAANAGWVDFRPDRPTAPEGVVFGSHVLGGLAHAPNFGWIDLGSGNPANGIRYQNTSGTDFGVNHDGEGNLSGLAYAANIGWINFGWAPPGDVHRPRVDLLTGKFVGHAYSANIGWINLGTDLTTTAMQVRDDDADGMDDAWERETFGDTTTATLTSQSDADGVSDRDEFRADTDPQDPGSSFQIVSSVFDQGVTQATVVFTSSPTRVYRLLVCDQLGLTPFIDSGLGTFAPDAGATTTRVIIWPGTSRKLIRVASYLPLTAP